MNKFLDKLARYSRTHCTTSRYEKETFLALLAFRQKEIETAEYIIYNSKLANHKVLLLLLNMMVKLQNISQISAVILTGFIGTLHQWGNIMMLDVGAIIKDMSLTLVL